MTNKGFTLLEVLIAVFILALMSMMIWQITSNAQRGASKAESYNDVYHYARVALKKVTDDMTMSYLASAVLQGKKMDGTTSFETHFIGEGSGDKDSVNFATFAGVRLIKNEKKSDQVEVGYSVEDCPEAEEKILCLMRRESIVVDDDVKEGGNSYPVAKGVKKFNLEYYDPSKEEWRDDWSTKDPVFANKLPRAVRVAITFQDPRKEDKELVFTTSVMMPLSSGAIDF